MFRSLFGKKKKPAAKVPSDESIRSAKVGDVVFIPGFWDDGEDAYLIVDDIIMVESAYGRGVRDDLRGRRQAGYDRVVGL